MKLLTTFRFTLIGLLLASGQAFAARTVDSVNFSGASSVTVAVSGTISTTVQVTTTGGNSVNDWRATGWLIASTPPGTLTCANHPNHNNNASTYTETFNITAPATAGTYNAYFIAYDDNGCTSGASVLFTMNNAVTVTPPPTITIDSADFGGSSTISVMAGSSISTTVQVTTSGSGTSNDWLTTGWLIASAPPGALTCANTSDYTSSGTNSETFTITAPSVVGTYNAYYVAYNGSSCSGGSSLLYTLPNAVVVQAPSTNIVIDSADFSGASTVYASAGASISTTVQVTTSWGGYSTSNDWVSTGWLIANTAPGSINCADTADHTWSGTNSETFNITAPTVEGTYNAYYVAYNGNACSGEFSVLYTLPNAVTVGPPPPPQVSTIDRASFNPTAAGTVVSWTVIFSDVVTGVDLSDFVLATSGGVTGAYLTAISGSGDTYTVSANTGTGGSGSLGLNLVDDDTIVNASLKPLGGVGTGNGDFNGQSYTLLAAVCDGSANILFCDDFERSNPGGVGNGWTVIPASVTNCSGVSGNTGCAGIDSDIPPYDTYTNPRANPTRSMFTRWSIVSVDSPVIDLSASAGAQFTFWMRRGSDSFSEDPDATGENYLIKYLDNTGTWKILAQYPSGLSYGQVYNPTIQLPADAFHANFQLRFYQPSGSGSNSTSGGAPGVRGYDYWHLDNVIIREVPEPTFVGAFCDNFEGGLGRWSISAEGAPASAAIGDASIGTLAYSSASHELDMRWGYVSAATFKTDLTGVTGNISYWIRSGTNTTRDPVTGEDLIVEYYNDAGGWTTLETLAGADAMGTIYNSTFTLPADAAHTDFRLRFRKLNGGGYDKSYWHVDDVCVGDPIPTADLALTKVGTTLVPGTTSDYTLTITNNGPGTLAGSVEVIDTLPTGLSYLTHSGTGWTCGANNQIVTCNWSGTLTSGTSAPPLVLTVNVSGSATGTITNSATLTGTVVDNVPGNNTATYQTTIYVPAYVFTDKACTSGTAIGAGANPCNLVDWSSLGAGVDKGPIYITALDSSGKPAALNPSSVTTVSMDFGLSCHNPVSDAGIQATFPSSTDLLPLCASNGATPSSWSSAVSMDFAAGSPSVGPFSFNYADVGNIELFMRNSAATTQIGSSGQFVVKPYGLVLSEIKPTANPSGRCAVNTTPAPAVTCASNATGGQFVRSGEAFSVTVTAVNAAGNATPNFGNESSPDTEGVLLTPALVTGLGLTQNPALTFTIGFSSFTNGVATATDFSWGEVGIITLTPSIADADYLGAGDITGTTAGPVGRFYPDHFDVAHAATPACGGTFTYAGLAGSANKSGQSFAVAGTVTAKNSANGTTQNYAGNFALLATGGVTANPWIAGVQNTTDTLNWGVDTLSFTNGVGDFNENNASYDFASEGAPQSMYLRVTANDGEATGTETDASASLQASDYRYGRMRLENAYGPELVGITVPFQAEYFDSISGSYITNTEDGCTTLTLPGNLQLSVDDGATWVTADNTVSVGGGTTTATLASAAPLSLGVAGLSFSAPGALNTGYVDLRTQISATFPWLLFDWDGDGTQDEASGRVNFGLYSGSTRHIYLRELY